MKKNLVLVAASIIVVSAAVVALVLAISGTSKVVEPVAPSDDPGTFTVVQCSNDGRDLIVEGTVVAPADLPLVNVIVRFTDDDGALAEANLAEEDEPIRSLDADETAPVTLRATADRTPRGVVDCTARVTSG